MSQLYTKEYRDNFRKSTLNTLLKLHGDKEVFYLHPLIDDVAFSNKGRAKNLATGNILKCQKNSNGYLGINVWIHGKGRRFTFLHRLLAESVYSFTGVNNYFYEVNHIDGNKYNNNLENLEWLTREENLEHSRINRLSLKAKLEKENERISQ